MQPIEIKQARKELGLSQQKLADLTFKNIRTIQRYEKGDLNPQKLWLNVFEKIIKKSKKSS